MMVFQVSVFAVLALVCSTVATDVPSPALVSGLCGQCTEILSTIKTSVLAEMKSVTPDKLPSVVCDLDDKELQTQCIEVITDNGAELLNFLETMDEGDVCKAICEDLGMAENTDSSLYFQSEKGATKTDDVSSVDGSFVCSICKKVMSFIRVFLTGRTHQGFILHVLKGFCHYVPMFRTECDLLINMYGRLIIRLASRYLNPKLCYTFRLCPRQLHPSSCMDVLKFGGHNTTKSATYTVYNARKEPTKVYCSFRHRHIITYVNTKNKNAVDLHKLYNNKKHVLIRYLNKNNKQFETHLGQISLFKKTPLSVQYNTHNRYAAPQNRKMTPYMYLGFIPISQSRKGATQGYATNGKNNVFRNCDGNPNSYFTFLFNHGSRKPVKYGPFDSPLMHAWEKTAIPIPVNAHIPFEYFSFYEIHFGGCGGYATTQQFPNVKGAALGLRYGTVNVSSYQA